MIPKAVVLLSGGMDSATPDCRPKYLEAVQHLAALSSKAGLEGSPKGRRAQKLLSDLRRMQWLHDGLPSAVYANGLLRTMQNLFDQAPDESLIEVLMVFHDAMAFQNRWIDYTPEQYQGAYTLCENLVKHTKP